ncbi:hypothetical protein JCM10908_002061 [Rhodotorula pacifica]|uniref:uncharacterized protein n=1 Tax=Rhodotorula pacifica TaxID=1495444 RepID=UPI00316D977E
MLTLDKLPLTILLYIIEYFPVGYIANENEIVKWRFGPDESCKSNAPETIALAACNRSLRRLLLPVLFHDCHFGQAEPSDRYAKRLEALSRGSGELLACIRNLTVMAFTPKGIETANTCIAQMTSLETIGWYATHSVPPLFVQTLSNIPSFTSLVFHEFGVESLPHILPLAGQITKLQVDTKRKAPCSKRVIGLAPITVGHPRRSRLPWDDRNIATIQEQRDAFFRGLPAFLLRARQHLQELCIEGRGLTEKTAPSAFPWLQHLFDAMMDDNRQYPIFPSLECLWLRRADVKALALKHLTKTCANHLRILEVASLDQTDLPARQQPLPKLKEFCYLMQDGVRCAKFVQSFTQFSPLETLYLNGVAPSEVPELFGRLFRCGDSLRQLRIQQGEVGEFFTLAHVRQLVAACPNLFALEFGACYGMEAVELLDALKPLTKLRRFAFDHPWEKPRTSTFVEADGRTIRSRRNGDFRIISVIGTSIEHEVAKRIRWDIDAVRPTYRKRFGEFAKRMPDLQRVRWHCTEAVTWTWTFERRFDTETGQQTIVCRDVPDIPYGKATAGRQETRSGIYALG